MLPILLCALVAVACSSKSDRPPFYDRHPHDDASASSDASARPKPERDAGNTASSDEVASSTDDEQAGTGGTVEAATGGSGDPPVEPGGCEDGPIVRILFIGNSHTSTNGVPALVRELACAAGTKVVTMQSTPGGASLNDHVENASTLAAIAADDWDYVVLQDQQQFPGSRLRGLETYHLPAALTLVDASRQHRAQTQVVFYMVWARQDGDAQNCEYFPLLCTFAGMTRGVSQGYRFYAERTRTEVSPVALAWQAVHDDPESPVAPAALWKDGSHASLAGSYLAAALLTGTLLDISTAPLAYHGKLDAQVASYLRTMADRFVSAEAADPRVYTQERIAILCPYGGACSDVADSKPVTLAISLDPCADLSAGTADVRGRIDTTLSCEDSRCDTAALGDFHAAAGGALEDGTYQLHVHVDVNENDEIDSGDLETCETGAFVIGSGTDVTVSELSTVP